MREQARPGKQARPAKQGSEERAAGPAQPRAAELTGPVSDLLALQRAAGNAAVNIMLMRAGRRHRRHEERAHHAEETRVQWRLRVANDAIEHVQREIPHAANQEAALMQTLYNSSLRAVVQDHDGFWDLSRLPAGTSQYELKAAKALRARSMICETAAECMFSHLRQRARGEELIMVMHPQQRHWFVIIGGENEDPSEWVVADPWPTHARAVEWKDHFCYSPGLESVFVHKKMRADGNDAAGHLAHLISLNSAGRYVARWDLGMLGGRTNIEIGQMLQRAGVEMNLDQDDLAEQIMAGLANADGWSTDDIGTWPIEQLEVWCLAQIDEPIVRRLLARPGSSGNHRDLRHEIAGGIREVRETNGDNSWIWNIPHAHAQRAEPVNRTASPRG